MSFDSRWAIGDNRGQWWIGSGWGVRQARETYAWEDLPQSLDVEDGDLTLEIHIGTGDPELRDARYYAQDAQDSTGSVILAS